LRVVQEIAGHASPTMTARYAEGSDAAKQEAIREVFG
jgi:integrase